MDKKIARVAGIRSLKKNFPGVAGGMYPVGIDWDIKCQTVNLKMPKNKGLSQLKSNFPEQPKEAESIAVGEKCIQELGCRKAN